MQYRSTISRFLVLTSLIAAPYLPVSAQPAPERQFLDIEGDTYVGEIDTAARSGIVSGFPDRTFRPRESLTREQLLSIMVDAMPKVPLTNLNLSSPPTPKPLPKVPTQVSSNPFPDTSKNRWSAAKIQYMKDLGIIRGYPDGTFRPTQTVTRAELIVMLDAVDRFLVEWRGNWDAQQFLGALPPLPFSDVRGHWAENKIQQMSSYCFQQRVATYLDEKGTKFAPNAPAQRNYAAAATLRAVQCLSIYPPSPS
ncbi:S-layer homology domain-containing protein [Oscillatoria sp. FACHB-1406]|nr:S-layer homology domain-containing protein [Oscillatoria sp. FACHB-1406]